MLLEPHASYGYINDYMWESFISAGLIIKLGAGLAVARFICLIIELFSDP